MVRDWGHSFRGADSKNICQQEFYSFELDLLSMAVNACVIYSL